MMIKVKLNNIEQLNNDEYLQEKQWLVDHLQDIQFGIETVGHNRDGNHYKIHVNRLVFPYWEGSAHKPLTEDNAIDKIISWLYCTVSDYSCLVNCCDIQDFCDEFGYDYHEGKKIYTQIKTLTEKILKVFTITQLNYMYETVFQNY